MIPEIDLERILEFIKTAPGVIEMILAFVVGLFAIHITIAYWHEKKFRHPQNQLLSLLAISFFLAAISAVLFSSGLIRIVSNPIDITTIPSTTP